MQRKKSFFGTNIGFACIPCHFSCFADDFTKWKANACNWIDKHAQYANLFNSIKLPLFPILHNPKLVAFVELSELENDAKNTCWIYHIYPSCFSFYVFLFKKFSKLNFLTSPHSFSSELICRIHVELLNETTFLFNNFWRWNRNYKVYIHFKF